VPCVWQHCLWLWHRNLHFLYIHYYFIIIAWQLLLIFSQHMNMRTSSTKSSQMTVVDYSKKKVRGKCGSDARCSRAFRMLRYVTVRDAWRVSKAILALRKVGTDASFFRLNHNLFSIYSFIWLYCFIAEVRTHCYLERILKIYNVHNRH